MAHRVKRTLTNGKREKLRKENEEWVKRMRTKKRGEIQTRKGTKG